MNDLLTVARSAAAGAAAVHATHVGRVTPDRWSEKAAADFVSHVDHEAEAVIIEHVRSAFPDHAIFAEEAESERVAGSGVTEMQDAREWTWIIDPLDGTTNYLHGYPVYAVSIAIARAGSIQAAVVLNSATGQEWTATRGGGAYQDGRRITVSSTDRPSHALIGTGFPFKALHLLPEYMRQFDAVLRASAGIRRAGSAAIDLCHVASGWFDAFWELWLAPWDIAAGSLIVSEAGGIVTRLDGSPADGADATTGLLATGSLLVGNPAMHAALGTIVRNAAAASQHG